MFQNVNSLKGNSLGAISEEMKESVLLTLLKNVILLSVNRLNNILKIIIMNKKENVNAINIILFIVALFFIILCLQVRKDPTRRETMGASLKPTKQVRKTELNPETLRQYAGFEKTSDIEAQIQIDAIKRMAKVLFYLHTMKDQANNI